MRGIKWMVFAIIAVLLSAIAYMGLLTRQSAQGSVPAAQGRANALEREMAETTRIVGGPRK